MVASISKRENQVLELISKDYTDKDIASKLYISHNTVKTHKKNLYNKLDVKRAGGLIRKAFEIGLLK